MQKNKLTDVALNLLVADVAGLRDELRGFAANLQSLFDGLGGTARATRKT
ncbi:MAG: hypothetical protein AMXMBFR84_16600 [Candidatus Hydrogenedentota bacterium]